MSVPGKRKGKNGNKLSQEEIDNLTAEDLEKYILNEGKKFSPSKSRVDDNETGNS